MDDEATSTAVGRAAARFRTELFGQGRGRVLCFCWLGWVFDFYDLILFAFVKGSVAAELGLALETHIAWVDGLTLGATALGGVAFGRIADLVGRRRALTWSILTFSVGMLLTSLAGGFWSLLGARVITGFGVGGEWGVGHAVVAEAYPERLRARAAGILQAGSPVAMALAAAVGCFIAPQVGWRAVFLWSALPGVLALFARLALRGDDAPPAGGRGRVRDLFRGRLLRPSVVLLAVLMLHMTGFWCTYAWLPRHLLSAANVDIAFVGWFQIGVNAVHVVADVGFGFVADRFGRRRTFAAFCALFALGAAAVAVGYDTLATDPVVFGIAIAAIGLGAGTWSCFGVLFATHYPPGLRATAASGFYNAARGVQLVTQPMMGLLFLWTESFAPALWVGAATAVLSGVAIFGLRSAAVPEQVGDAGR